MKRPDGAYMTMGEMEEAIRWRDVEIDNLRERIMKLEAAFEKQSEHVEYEDLDDYAFTLGA